MSVGSVAVSRRIARPPYSSRNSRLRESARFIQLGLRISTSDSWDRRLRRGPGDEAVVDVINRLGAVEVYRGTAVLGRMGKARQTDENVSVRGYARHRPELYDRAAPDSNAIRYSHLESRSIVTRYSVQ